MNNQPEPTYWYQCQERAMAPGSGDGWPATIRPQHSANARLVRREGDPEKEIAALLARCKALEEAMASIAKYADNAAGVCWLSSDKVLAIARAALAAKP